MYQRSYTVWLIGVIVSFAVIVARGDESAGHPADYVLGPDDQVAIRSLEVKELGDKTFRIDGTGEINLPLVGRVAAAGKTIPQLEALLIETLRQFYVEPDIAVNMTEYRSEPVSVIGSVGNPGVHPARGRRSLLEVLAAAGGVRPDAGPVVKITRQKTYGPLPIPGARYTPDGSNIGEIRLKNLLEAQDPTLNIIIQPHDIITIPRGAIVYVVGNVKRSGGFPLEGRTRLSVLEALSLAEGLDMRAAASHARILRAPNDENSGRQEVAVDLSRIMSGKARDLYLGPNDVLFVPNSAAKSVTTRSIETALQIGTGIVIWRH